MSAVCTNTDQRTVAELCGYISRRERGLFSYLVVCCLVVCLVERKIRGSNPACDGIFSGSSHTSDSKIGTPVASLPEAWRYWVSAGTGRPGVSIL